MNVAIVIQARLSSKRFPRKILTDIAGRPLLQRLLDRAKQWNLGKVIVATPLEEVGDIMRGVRAEGVAFHGGSHDDVLARYVTALDDCDYVLRVTADCPIFDISNAWMLVARAEQGGEKYIAIDPDYGWPRGADLELFSWDALLKANWLAKDPYDREHVTPFIKRDETISKYYFRYEPDMSHVRLCVDTEPDAALVSSVYRKAQYKFDGDFTIDQALKCL